MIARAFGCDGVKKATIYAIAHGMTKLCKGSCVLLLQLEDRSAPITNRERVTVSGTRPAKALIHTVRTRPRPSTIHCHNVSSENLRFILFYVTAVFFQQVKSD